MSEGIDPGRRVGIGAAHLYSIYGLAVLSDFELPEASVHPQASAFVAPDVRIESGRTPRDITGGREFASWIVANDRACLLRFNGIGHFYVEDGRLIVVEKAEEATVDDLRAFLLGSGMGAILHMRGLVPLHVSALSAREGVIAFTGGSGAGKSTLAAFLNQQYQLPLICDDVGVLQTAGSGYSLVSGVNTLKLWDDALKSLGRESTGLRRDSTRHNKFHATDASKFTDDKRLLKHLVQLEWGDELGYRRVTGRNAFKIAMGSVYRPEFAQIFSNVGAIASSSMSLAAQIDVGILTRPRDHAKSTAIAALLRSVMSTT